MSLVEFVHVSSVDTKQVRYERADQALDIIVSNCGDDEMRSIKKCSISIQPHRIQCFCLCRTPALAQILEGMSYPVLVLDFLHMSCRNPTFHRNGHRWVLPKCLACLIILARDLSNDVTLSEPQRRME